jgi:hypothetical protein
MTDQKTDQEVPKKKHAGGRPKKIVAPPALAATPAPGSPEMIAAIQTALLSPDITIARSAALVAALKYNTDEERKKLRADLAEANATIDSLEVKLVAAKLLIDSHKEEEAEYEAELKELNSANAVLQAWKDGAHTVEARVAGELAAQKEIEAQAARAEQKRIDDARERDAQIRDAQERIGPLKEKLKTIMSLQYTHPYSQQLSNPPRMPFDVFGQNLVQDWLTDKAWVAKQIDDLQNIIDGKVPAPAPPATAPLGPNAAAPTPAPSAAPTPSQSSFDPAIQERLATMPTLEERAEMEKAEGVFAQKPEDMTSEEWEANRKRVAALGNSTEFAKRKWGLLPLTEREIREEIERIEVIRQREGLVSPTTL